jgi:hypothetical protein
MIVSLPWKLIARPPQDSPGLGQLCLFSRGVHSKSSEEVNDDME